MCTILTHAVLSLHDHCMSLSTGDEYWWILIRDTCFAHKNQITLQTSLWDHIPTGIATAYKLIQWRASEWQTDWFLHHLLHTTPTTNATSYQKIIYLLTYLLTLWSRVLIEKLTGSQLVKECPTFYGTWRYIAAFTTACQLSLFQARPIQSFGLFPNILTLPPFQRIYYQSLYCDFILHSDLETWPCT